MNNNCAPEGTAIIHVIVSPSGTDLNYETATATTIETTTSITKEKTEPTTIKKRRINWSRIENQVTKTNNFLNKSKTTKTGREIRLINRNNLIASRNEELKKSSLVPIPEPFKRRLPESARSCSTCGKILVGYRKILKHIEQNPDHNPISLPEPKINQLWQDLLLRAKDMPKGLRAQRFFDEIIALINKLRSLKKLISVNNFEQNPAFRKYYFNNDLSTLLSIPIGNNYVNENVLFSELDSPSTSNRGDRDSFLGSADLILTDSISENLDQMVKEHLQDFTDDDLKNTAADLTCFDLSSMELIKFENN